MTEKRKGARSVKDIPQEILEQLNQGKMETVNLTEWLAVDQKILLENLLKQNDRLDYLQPILENINTLKKQTVNTINEAIGTEIFNLTVKNNDKNFLDTVAKHSSDLVRCWATYTIGKNQNLCIAEKLERIKIFAADHHFGVREICWMAVRSDISIHLKEALSILSTWTNNDDENIRRFASESTRPRGVWCANIEELKQNPELGLQILNPMKSDKAKYVQDSVGNWLNDASKSKPDFVKNVCEKWLEESPTKETKYIVKKALRTIQK
ncbi:MULTISPECIES: DNA alkylation repair protein [unclassified Chryseobacterium]|uniref:DNA alkylation repair protein n=1 Tax=unclassified Chryseobacterium TaxID=2593645 RepID=UPI00226A9185|nr:MULTISPECIES: DNA alkylation repair protein [unclassified Chryseobacterium]